MKAQVWYVDFFFAIILFLISIVFLNNYLSNTDFVQDDTLEDLMLDAKSISSFLMSEGYPRNWTNHTVETIGVLKNNKIDFDKTNTFFAMDYSEARTLFNTKYDFLFYIEDDNNTIFRFDDKCGIGYGSINTEANTSLTKGAYFYQGEHEMEGPIENLSIKLNITFDKDWTSANHLLNNIENYTLLVLENSQLNGPQVDLLEDYIKDGGIVFMSERILNNNGDVAGVNYYKRTVSNWNATIIYEDPKFGFAIGEKINSYENPHVEDDFVPGPGDENATNFVRIAEFDDDGTTSIAKWNYGSGEVYYFSDFDTDYFNGNFQYEVKLALVPYLYGVCTGINFNITADKIVRIERFPIYQNDIVKMVVYLWD